jgi:hypothetical protein
MYRKLNTVHDEQGDLFFVPTKAPRFSKGLAEPARPASARHDRFSPTQSGSSPGESDRRALQLALRMKTDRIRMESNLDSTFYHIITRIRI